MERPTMRHCSITRDIWEPFCKGKGRTFLPGLFNFICLFGGGRTACSEECRQFADIGLIRPGEVIATCRTPAARTALTRLAGFALGLDRLLIAGLDRFHDGWLCRLAGNHRLLAFTFGAEPIAIALAVAARLALAILLAILARWTLFALLLARLFTLALLLIAILLHILLLRLGLGRREARVHLGHIVIVIVIPIRTLAILGLLGAGDDAEIVLGMLEIVLRHHRIAARLRVSR
jgi:hypothetical protein